MGFRERNPPGLGAEAVAVRRHLLLLCVSACLGTALLLVSTACGSTRCSPSMEHHQCSDASHYIECGGGEGYEYVEDVPCPDVAPVCMEINGDVICRSRDESECLVLDGARRGSSVRAADLNGDGLSDLVFLDHGSVYRALAVSAGGFAAPVEIAKEVASFELSELTRDSRVDLLLRESDKVVLAPGVGDGSFDTHVMRVLLENTKEILGVFDMDADGFDDIVASNWAGKLTALQSGTDFTPLTLELAPPSNPMRAFAADLDGDSAVELLVEDGQAHVGIYHFDVDAWIQTDTLLGSIALLADFNADDTPDLVVNDGDFVTVRLGQPGGGFEGVASFDGHAFMAGDLNADGHVDLLLSRSHQSQMVRLDGNGDGTFKEGTPLDVRDSPESAQAIVTGTETRVVFASGNGFIAEFKASCLARP